MPTAIGEKMGPVFYSIFNLDCLNEGGHLKFQPSLFGKADEARAVLGFDRIERMSDYSRLRS